MGLSPGSRASLQEQQESCFHNNWRHVSGYDGVWQGNLVNRWDFFCLRGQENSIQSFYNLHSHSTWALTKVNLGVVCTPGVHQELV